MIKELKFQGRTKAMVRVRFAPSPTGYLHIGGARTALFNWMYARSQGGVFLLRIEDTDRERSKEEYLQEILESMEWLGLKWDEFYCQSERFTIYREHAQRLLQEGKAFKEGEAILLKMPKKKVKIFDLIRDEIEVDTETLKDQVLMKSDGTPAYSFACVVDDALMGISHVIRGEDHISNTPKQIVIYEALGFKIPKFAHLPLILGEEGGRLSKRHGAVAVSDYKKEGFLPEAVVNYLMLLGWSPGNNQEMIPLESAVKKFSIKKINKAGAAFSLEKLKWLNAQYIRKLDSDHLTELLVPFLKDKGYINDNYDRKNLKNIVHLYQSRIGTLIDFLDWTRYLFNDKVLISGEDKQRFLIKDKTKTFQLLSERLNKIEEFNAQTTEEVFRKIVEESGIKAADLVHPVRVALTGKTVGPGLFETMAVLGREKTVQRLTEILKDNDQ